MRRPLLITALVLAQAALVTASVGPTLLLRATGEPRDVAVVLSAPWSGNSVGVGLAGLGGPWETPDTYDETWSMPSGTLHVPLVEDGAVWRATGWQRDRPEGVHLTCDSDGWSLDCGFSSFESAELVERLPSPERNDVVEGVASLRTDDKGRAVLVDVRLND